MKYSIVILTYKRDDVVVKIIEDIKSHLSGRSDFEVILVDNNPDDVDRRHLIEWAPAATWLRMGVNHGVVSRNTGMKAACGEFIILVDDDCYITTKSFLDIFSKTFEQDPKIGAVSVQKRIRDETHMRRDIIPHTRKNVDVSRPFYTFRIVGGCVAFRRAMFERVGGFNPEIFYGLEEIDYAYRIISDGWKIFYTPDISCVEMEDRGGRMPDKVVFTYRIRNKFIISYLHMPFPQIIFNFALFPIYAFIFYSGSVNIFKAVTDFIRWLSRPGHARRDPIGAEAIAYIRSCGGSTWR